MNKLVSIVSPCYNGEAYVERFLNSIISQTYRPLELIIVNDGSTDKTEEIVVENSYFDQGDIWDYLIRLKMYLKKSKNNKTGRTYLYIADGYHDREKGYTKTITTEDK